MVNAVVNAALCRQAGKRRERVALGESAVLGLQFK